MPKKDIQATAKRKFVECKSYVDKQGNDVLFGLDWARRKKELAARCEERCEEIITLPGGETVRCAREAAHPHHIIKKSQSRIDNLSNLIALCVEHHRQRHPEKQPMWTRKGEAA